MGVYTYGSATALFSRALTEEEFGAWLEAIQRDPYSTEDRDGELFDPERWAFPGDTTTGDIGQLDADVRWFTVESAGKVYDLVDAARHFVRSLPDDVTVEGGGQFETEGTYWGLRFQGREVKEVELVLASPVELEDKRAELWDRILEVAREAVPGTPPTPSDAAPIVRGVLVGLTEAYSILIGETKEVVAKRIGDALAGEAAR